jgi:hypothetical protein
VKRNRASGYRFAIMCVESVLYAVRNRKEDEAIKQGMNQLQWSNLNFTLSVPVPVRCNFSVALLHYGFRVDVDC